MLTDHDEEKLKKILGQTYGRLSLSYESDKWILYHKIRYSKFTYFKILIRFYMKSGNSLWYDAPCCEEVIAMGSTIKELLNEVCSSS